MAELTYDYLKPYFCGERYHFFYDRALKSCKAFEPHSEGCFPCELIECRRPNEPLEVKDYRKIIWVPKTKPTFSRIVSSLSKIRRSPDWSIKYTGIQNFPKIREGETLEDYSEKNFPYFQSVTNWMFSVCLKKYLTDPNGVILVMPLETEVEPTEYLRPYPTIFDCCDVVEFVAEDHAILNNPAGCYYQVRDRNKNKMVRGKSYFVVDTVSIIKYDQIDAKGNMTLVSEYQHGLGRLPVFKIGGVICESQGSNYMYESRINGILPELDEAVREYSDLQAAKVLHVYPERWEYTSHECTTCKGTGRRQNPAWFTGCDASIQSQIDCLTCSGRGYIASGPYSKLLVKPADMGKQQLPTPPAGYVEKDSEIVKLMDESVRQHIYDALASINFQELASVPMSQSGIAKAVDRDEQNNTVHAIAEDIVKIMDQLYSLNADYRYMDIYSFEEIEAMLPAIAVPEKFDLFSIANLQDDLKKAKDSKMNPVTLNAMEVDYAGKLFNTDHSIRDMVALTIKLDPLPGISEDEKMSRLSNKGILPESYIISSNINEFVQRAIEEDPTFPTKPLQEQKAIILEYATEVMDKLDTSKKIVSDATSDPQISVGDMVTIKPGNGQPTDPVQVVAINGNIAQVKVGNTTQDFPIDQLTALQTA